MRTAPLRTASAIALPVGAISNCKMAINQGCAGPALFWQQQCEEVSAAGVLDDPYSKVVHGARQHSVFSGRPISRCHCCEKVFSKRSGCWVACVSLVGSKAALHACREETLSPICRRKQRGCGSLPSEHGMLPELAAHVRLVGCPACSRVSALARFIVQGDPLILALLCCADAGLLSVCRTY